MAVIGDRQRDVVITGAAGQIGSRILERLAARWRIRATDVRPGDGIDRAGFTVVNGISANRHRIAELGDAEREIGYAPVDDAWACEPGPGGAVPITRWPVGT